MRHFDFLKPPPWAAMGLVLLAMATADRSEAQRIRVSQNVQVTAVEGAIPHGEVVIAADPRDSKRLIAGAMAYYPDRSGATTVVYATTDAGLSWHKTLQHEAASGRGGGDPTLAYGADGQAYFATLSNMASPSMATTMHLFTYYSPDGGQSWKRSTSIAEHERVDRPFLAVDTSSSSYHGRVYVFGQMQTKLLDVATPAPDQSPWAVALWHSNDSGRTFDMPATRARAEPAAYIYPGNSTILSDGTVVGVYFAMDARKPGTEFEANRAGLPRNGFVRSIASRDGGTSLDAAVTIDALHHDGGYTAFSLPSVAADAGQSVFKDRVYAVWTDGRSGRDEILFSYSTDAGKSWSASRPMNDDRPFAKGAPGPDDFMPMVTVNQNGVVGVTWYDRRDNLDNVGYYVRFSASLDGGETFLPSVRVSSAPKVFDRGEQVVMGASNTRQRGTNAVTSLRFRRKFSPASGHTAGLTIDAAGVFHAVWVDNRTGIDQVWTASITAEGSAIRNGATSLATLVDQSGQLRLELTPPSYDRRTSTIVTDARLRNTSTKTISGVLVVRVVRMASSLGTPSVMNADNGANGMGAVWRFGSALIGKALAPGEATPVKHLVFQLADPQPFFERGRFALDLLTVDTRLLGPPDRASP